PNDSAPTLSATQPSAPSPPADAAAGGSSGHRPGAAPLRGRRPDSIASSTSPHPSSTSTRYGPTVAAATAPAATYVSHRSRRRTPPRALRQLGHARPSAARTATAATAAPAPAPAPRIHNGGE